MCIKTSHCTQICCVNTRRSSFSLLSYNNVGTLPSQKSMVGSTHEKEVTEVKVLGKWGLYSAGSDIIL